MSVISPLMNLVISTIGVDSGLLWEQNLNSSLLTIDQHNHTSGSGAQIPTAGLNINSDLPLNSNNLTFARSVRFAVQSSPLSTGADLSCLYSSGAAGNLFFNDGAGNQVQITSGGNVNATSSGISSGTASASFVSSVLVVDAATNTPANIQGASLLLGNNIASSNYLTLAPPSAMASSFGLTLPNVPVATSFMQVDTSGNMSASIPISAGITRANLTPPGQQISAGHNFSTFSGNFDAIVGSSVTIVTNGNPVLLILNGNFEAVRSTAGQSGYAVALSKAGSLYINFGSNEWYDPVGGASFSGAQSYVFMDVVPAGTYVYGMMLESFSTAVTAYAFSAQIFAYEIK